MHHVHLLTHRPARVRLPHCSLHLVKKFEVPSFLLALLVPDLVWLPPAPEFLSEVNRAPATACSCCCPDRDFPRGHRPCRLPWWLLTRAYSTRAYQGHEVCVSSSLCFQAITLPGETPEMRRARRLLLCLPSLSLSCSVIVPLFPPRPAQKSGVFVCVCGLTSQHIVKSFCEVILHSLKT